MKKSASSKGAKKSAKKSKIGKLSILDAIERIRGRGSYYATGQVPFVSPGLALPDGTELEFPLSRKMAGALRDAAAPAPYGMGSKTVHNDDVRKCSQLDANDLNFSHEWQAAVGVIVARVAGELGVEGQVTAEPYKLLLYEKGGLFLPHRDTEKTESMFATLIVALPSTYKGGELNIRHGRESHQVDFTQPVRNWKYSDAGEGAADLRYAAFYADCEHEVKRITSGFRVCVAYNLTLKVGSPAALTLPQETNSESLVPMLEALRKSGCADLTAILLEHRYTEANLSVAKLKNHDLARAKALFAAAAQTEFEAHLTLVSLHQMGELEGAYEYAYSRGRRWGGARRRSDHEMSDLHEETLTIDEWRSASDRKVRLPTFEIDKSRVVTDEPIGSGKPDEMEEEEYTGNAGATMEYWYHHAAIVVWPREVREQVMAQYDFAGSCASLLVMAANTNAADKPAFQRLGQAVIRQVGASRGAAQDTSLLVLEALAISGSTKLLEECSPELLLRLLQHCNVSIWQELIETYGTEPWRPFLTTPLPQLDKQGLDASFHAIGALLGVAREYRESSAAPFVERLAELVQEVVTNGNTHRHFDRRQRDGDMVQFLHVAVAASFLVTAQKSRQRLMNTLVDIPGNSKMPQLSFSREILAPALLKKTHRRHFAEDGSLFPELLALVIGLLEEEIRTELKPYPDWTRPCKELQESHYGYRRVSDASSKLKDFMANAAEQEYRFQYPEDVRRTLQSQIGHAQLDLDCRTEKTGSPHTLVCKKNNNSYLRAKSLRAADEKLLRALRGIEPGAKKARAGRQGKNSGRQT